MTSVEKIQIFSPYQKTLTLVLGDESDNGLEVRELDGLDPTKSNIVTTSFPRQAGTQRQASRREPRTLKIKLGFDLFYGSETVEKLRQDLYAFFMPQMQVVCRYFLGSGLVVDVRGEVEDFVSPRSTEDPEATIQIYCFDPDFTSVAPLFTSRSDPGSYNKTLEYPGTVDSGVVLTVAPGRAYSAFDFKITGEDARDQVLSFAANVAIDEYLEISTVPGQKGAWAVKNGVRRSVLQGVSPGSAWPTLKPGENRIRMTMEGVPATFTLKYTNRYGGI